MSVGENIKILRKNNGLSQKQLADKVELSEITIRRYEKGINKPSVEVIYKLAEALEVSVYQIIGEQYESAVKDFSDLYDETEKELELKKESYPNTLDEKSRIKELVDFMLITTRVMNSQLIDKKQKHELAEIFQTVVAQWSKYMNNIDYEKAIKIYNLYSNITKIE